MCRVTHFLTDLLDGKLYEGIMSMTARWRGSTDLASVKIDARL
jgi:hypothetical protein